uniref:Uncharacterized protein n=1 Tax=Periophthalmus magnuspinnatus TaxID=409849 RepID=A0A3B4BC91_9GOBI
MAKTKELSKDTRNKTADLHQAGKTESAIVTHYAARDSNPAVPDVSPLLKPVHVQACLKFAIDHLDDSEEDWDNVIWLDETKIELFGKNSTCHIWRRKNAACRKHGGRNIMLWGCFSPGRGPSAGSARSAPEETPPSSGPREQGDKWISYEVS